MVKLDRVEHTVEIPEGVTASIDGDTVTITGPKGKFLVILSAQGMTFSKKAAL